MEQTELLGSLRAIELRLSTSEVTALIRTQPPEVQDEFAQWTLQISIAISRLETSELGRINQELQQNGDGLRAGIASLQQSLVKLADAREIMDTIAQVIGVVLTVLAVF